MTQFRGGKFEFCKKNWTYADHGLDVVHGVLGLESIFAFVERHKTATCELNERKLVSALRASFVFDSVKIQYKINQSSELDEICTKNSSKWADATD